MDANELLMGRPKVKSAKFPDFEYRTVGGVIVRPPEVMQQRKYRKDGQLGDLEFWDDGRPKMQVAVNVQTAERDPSDPSDDGIRAFYLRWKIADAVKAAVLASGAQGLEVGGTLAIKHVSGNGNDAKEWAASYTPPTSNPAADAALMNGGPAVHAMAPAAQVAQPVQAQPAVAPVGAVIPGVDLSKLDPATLALIQQAQAQQAAPAPPF